MNYAFFSFISGLVFGIGLIIAGMANPAKVIGFLDIAGKWDPSLMLVMGGAILVGAVTFRVAKERTKSLLGFGMKMPDNSKIDTRLIGGSLMFGMGWGLGGFCPGPGLVAIGAGESKALVFVIAMIAGMILFEIIERPKLR